MHLEVLHSSSMIDTLKWAVHPSLIFKIHYHSAPALCLYHLSFSFPGVVLHARLAIYLSVNTSYFPPPVIPTAFIRTPFNMSKMNTASTPFIPPGRCSRSRFRFTCLYGGTAPCFVGQSTGFKVDEVKRLFGVRTDCGLSGEPELWSS